MISDEELDARLGEAGGRWRAVNTGAYAREAVPTETIVVTEATRSPFRSRWTLLVSAAAVVALLAGGGIWFANRPSSHNGAPAGPGPTETTTHGGLTGTDWKIFEVTKDSPNSADGLDALNSAATFHVAADGAVAGSDGCNSFSGSSTISDSTITLGALAVSAIGCRDTNVTKIASTIDAILTGAVTWHVQTSGNAMFLSIENAGVGSLIFVAAAPATPPVENPSKMAGTWLLAEADHASADGNSGSGSASSGDASQILGISADGTFKVQHRCYANSGSAVIGKGTADFGMAHLDGAVPCPSLDPEVMKDEQTRDALIDRVLSGPTTWKIENGQLRITKGEDTLVYNVYPSDAGLGAPSDSPS
jgi:heat shock protein HslJ